MVKVNIDGRDLEVEAGTRLIKAAIDAGIDIPHYCWHPRLSVAANCRMCLVEVEKAPKLLPSCEIPVRDGMVVRTASPRVLEARQAVMEFMLLNHPIDCPICDQAGECKLQDYYMAHDRTGTRFSGLKVVKKKAQPLGSTVMLDEERCINCTRCVRFMDEIAHRPLLGQFDRGDRAVIGVFPRRPLEDPYSLNVVDICPVGALTSRDFRFKVRAWFLKSAESVCPGCARGCNTRVDHYENEIQRLVPRDNDAVNQGWMCDEGRFTYRDLHDPKTLITTPHVRTASGEYAPVSWETARQKLAEMLAPFVGETDGSLGLAFSAQQTTEGIAAFVELAEQLLQVDAYAILGRPDGEGDDLLRMADKNPNRAGAELVLEAYSIFDEGPELLRRGLQEKRVRALIMVGGDYAAAEAGDVSAWTAALAESKVVCFASNWTDSARAASLVLPLASYAEQDGTFVNAQGRMQRIHRALKPLGGRKTAIEAATFTAEALGAGARWRIRDFAAAFAELKKRTGLLASVEPLKIGPQGVSLEADLGEGRDNEGAGDAGAGGDGSSGGSGPGSASGSGSGSSTNRRSPPPQASSHA